MTRTVRLVLAVVACLALPALASAQSAFTGVVKDTSGGVLPGVLVEASSDVLIEKVKSTVTDEAGAYRIIDLRPGTYTVTFTLTGFQVVKQESIQLPGDFTRTLNAELKLGTVSEVLTVTSAAPVVDVSNAVKVTSLDRQAMDNLPLGNNIWEMAQMIPSIDIYSTFTTQASSVGGANGATQVYMSVHGMTSAQNVVMVDGMTVSGLELDGTMQAYFNSDMNSEVSYQTSGISADRSGGGVTVNMIPREGGNRFSGNGKVSYRPHDWIANNSTQRLKDMGTSFVGTLDYLADVTVSEGGPIVRNKLWFFGSYHQFNTNDVVANSRDDFGNQTENAQEINQYSIRLTWQAAARHKVSGSYEKTDKTQSNAVGAADDPETAGVEWTSPNYSVGNIKLTSTLSSRLLFEGGYSFNRENRSLQAHSGINQERYSDAWYRNMTKSVNDGLGSPRSGSPYDGTSKDWPERDNAQGSISYVTGQHQIKAGVQWQWGRFYHATDTNGDINARWDTATLVGNNYVYNTPIDVGIRNTPVESQENLNADLGIYAQDSWRLKRLTLNAGLRWEHVNSSTAAFDVPEGRFVPKRSVPAVENVPDWYDWAPRFSMVYDLFGDARTALKYSVNRYNRSAAVSLAGGFNTLSVCVLTCAFIPWTETGLSGEGSLIPNVPEGRRTFTYNADGTITATDCVLGSPGCDIDLSALPKSPLYGTPAAQSQYSGFPRTWNLEQSFEVQHALTRRLSLTGNFTRGGDRDLTKTVNLAIQPGDFNAYTIYNPIDGTPITVYGIKDAAARTRIGPDSALNPNRISYVEPDRKRTYYQYGLEFRMRPYAGAQIFGGISLERLDEADCTTSMPNVYLNPNTLRFCDDYNLDAIDDNGLLEQATGGMDLGGRIPYSKDFRLGVTLPLPWYGINFGASYMNNDAGSYTVGYTIVPGTSATLSTRYPDGNSAGASATRKVANQPAPACPTAYGCVPGAFVLPDAAFLLPTSATSLTVNLAPQGGSAANFGGQGRLRSERLNQVDMKVSKTFRVKNMSILPTFEVYNLFNSDKIFSYTSTTYATTAGTYLIPSGILQSRIMALGAQVRW